MEWEVLLTISSWAKRDCEALIRTSTRTHPDTEIFLHFSRCSKLVRHLSECSECYQPYTDSMVVVVNRERAHHLIDFPFLCRTIQFSLCIPVLPVEPFQWWAFATASCTSSSAVSIVRDFQVNGLHTVFVCEYSPLISYLIRIQWVLFYYSHCCATKKSIRELLVHPSHKKDIHKFLSHRKLLDNTI